MIKILNIQTCVRSQHVMQSASAPLHYNTRKISLNLVCSLSFSHEALPKCRENYGDSLSVIYGIYLRRNIAKILVVSTMYVYTVNITMT